MAISDNIYQEALKGTGPIPPAQGVYEQSSTAKAELGTRIAFNDGRVYHYALAGGSNLSAGKMAKSLAIDITQHGVLAASIGTKTVTVTTSAALTTLAEGFLNVNDGTGQGFMYKIKKSAANSSTSTYTDLTLYDPIYTALVASANTEVALLDSPFRDLVVSTGTAAENIIGVPPITVTADYYFWLQTWGWATVLNEGGGAAAKQLISVGTSGDNGALSIPRYDADTQAVTDEAVLGYNWGMTAVDTEYSPVFLTILP